MRWGGDHGRAGEDARTAGAEWCGGKGEHGGVMCRGEKLSVMAVSVRDGHHLVRNPRGEIGRLVSV